MSDERLARHSDAIIIGAGPCGLFAAFQLGVHGLTSQLVDALDRVGGQCIELYPDKPIYDIPACPAIGAAELVERLTMQAACFSPVYHMGQQVASLERTAQGEWLVTTDKGLVLQASVVVIATGGGSFTPKTPPNLGRLAEFEGGAVRYAVPDVQAHAGERIVIAGGGDSAVDWAMALCPVASEIVLVHQREELRAQKHSTARLQTLVEEGRVRRLTGRVIDLHGTAPSLEAVTVHGREGRVVVPADRLLVFFGFVMREGALARFGLDLCDGLVPVDTERFETSLPGVFAIGDIATYPGKLKLILSGFHEAALMAAAAARRCRPGESPSTEYSTSSPLFRERTQSELGGRSP
ncbi:NAD(P)/FAD-dependent oxidoreductase [Reyranella sp.]|uniref:NAD(P)/FAD-dependent oxidoreductase n=1 Tax=Reyranella sp. TaxID=1929291 RepID=UPI003BACA27D